MSRQMVRFKREETRKTQILLIGGVIGALTGVGAAYLLWQAREKRARGTDEDLPIVSSGSLVKIGVLLFGLLRQIGELARGD